MPIVLDVRGAPVLVVGATEGARQKAALAASFGARVTVVAPDIGPEAASELRAAGVAAIERLAVTEEALWHRVATSRLVFCDTGDEAADRLMAALAAGARVPVNVVDKTYLCTFLMPAYARGEHYAVAVTTYGNSPLAARLLREQLEDWEGLRGFDDLVELQSELRARLQDTGLSLSRRAAILRRAAEDDGVRAALRAGRSQQARALALAIVERARVEDSS